MSGNFSTHGKCPEASRVVPLVSSSIWTHPNSHLQDKKKTSSAAPLISSSSSSSSSSMASFSPSPLSFHVPCSYTQKHHLVLCQASPSEIKRHQAEGPPSSSASVEVSRKSIGDHMKRRDFFTSSATISASALFLFASDRLSPAAMALLEADDDEQLLEKVKEDRKKKIKRRGEVNSFKEETGTKRKKTSFCYNAHTCAYVYVCIFA